MFLGTPWVVRGAATGGTVLTLLSSSQLFLSWFSGFFFFTILSCSSFFTSSSLHIYFSQLVVLSFQPFLVWVVWFKICWLFIFYLLFIFFMGLPKSIFYEFLCFDICGFFIFLVDLVFLWRLQATNLYFLGIFWEIGRASCRERVFILV